MKDKYSSKAQAENGIDNTTIMTPLRVKQSILVNSPTAPQAQQSDWNEADPTNPSYIKNKPVIPTKTSDLTNDGDDHASKYVKNLSPSNSLEGLDMPSAGQYQDHLMYHITGESPKTIANIDDLANKQDTLVSGTNIKTINNQSILGSGDLEIDTSVHKHWLWTLLRVTSTSDTAYTNLYNDINDDNKFVLYEVITSISSGSGKEYYEPVVYRRMSSGNMFVVYRDRNNIYRKIDFTVNGTAVTVTQTILTTPRDVQINGTSIVDTSTGYADILTNSAYDATNNKIATMSDLPTIPTVGDATLTIQKNGTTVETFTANATTNATANITVPTKVSDLNNDAGFLTTETDPVYSASVASGITSTDITNWNAAEPNVIEVVQVDSTPLTVTNKTVNITGKQDTLVSGTNIKTINNQSLLGSGNINVGGGGGSSDYNDLTNKPQINGNTLSGNKTAANLGFATVATSGSYTDLTNTPSIPTVNNGTLTIKRNGTQVTTFSANQSGNATADISVPSFVTETKDKYTGALASGSNTNIDFTISKTNYTPIGIVGVYCTGTRASFINVYAWYFTSSTNARVIIRNTHPSNALVNNDTKIIITILYVSNS